MGFLSDKPHTAVTTTIEQLTSDRYDEEDVADVVELLDIITIQPTGPTEAARALRKKLKYGSMHKQLRALTLLDALVQNGGSDLYPLYNDEQLLERLRVASMESLTEPRVKKKLQGLFLLWSRELSGKKGFERLTELHKQLPKRRVHEAKQREFYNDNEQGPSSSSRVRSRSSPPPPPKPARPNSGKNKSVKGKRRIDMTKEKPAINQSIAEASTAATNLSNALKLVNRETELSTENEHATECFDRCRKLRRQILKYIHNVESEEYIGSLIHANEELIQALRQYDAMSRPPEEDSDSDDWRVESKVRHLNVSDDDYTDSEPEEEHNPDNPFDDSHMITHTPVYEKPQPF